MGDEAVDYSGDQGLPALLASAARSAPVGTMLIEIAVGVLGAAAVLWWRPPATPAALSGALLLVAFGSWGVADLGLEDEQLGHVSRAGFRGARAVAAVVGWAALLVLAFSVAGLAIGHWKS